MPGGASLSRDQVSLPQPPIGGPAARELSFGELWKEVVSDPGPRTPEGTGGWRGGVWRCAAGLLALCLIAHFFSCRLSPPMSTEYRPFFNGSELALATWYAT